MKNPKAIFVLALLVILYTACEKKGTTTTTPTSPGEATSSNGINKGPDSSQAKFVPYTDTFYGMSYQYVPMATTDIYAPPPDSDSVGRMYVYVFHPNKSEISYTSIAPKLPNNLADPDMLEEIYGSYTLGSKPIDNDILIIVRGDSFFYTRYHVLCPDANFTYFIGKRVSAH